METLATFGQSIIELPLQLQAVIAVAVLYAVRAVLGRWLPEDKLSEIAAAFTAAVLTTLGALLGLIPPSLEGIATVLLNLLALLLGGVAVVNGYLKARKNGFLA